jgi:hypothetical protein
MMMLFGKDSKMVPESTRHTLTPSIITNADAELYGTIVLEIEATEVEELRKSLLRA